MADHNDFGKLAEEKATELLIQKGYQIIARNYRYLKSEIDIIAKIENTWVVVEVKARVTDVFVEPQEAINKKKIKLLVMAANHFAENNKEVGEIRFDIITALYEQGELKLHHIESAFESIDAN